MENEENKVNTINESDVVKSDEIENEIIKTTENVLNLKLDEEQNETNSIESKKEIGVIVNEQGSKEEEQEQQQQTSDIKEEPKEETKTESNQNVAEEELESKEDVNSNADNNTTTNKNAKDKKKREVDPATIPRKGYFFEHDDRDGDENKKEIDSKEKLSNQASNNRNTNNNNNNTTSGENAHLSINKRNRHNPKNRKPRQNSENNIDRWQHDKFDLTEQKPKTKQEIIKRYGYDIRQEKDTNKTKQINNENGNNNKKSLNKQDYSNKKNNEKLIERRYSHNFEDNDLDEEDDELQRDIMINNNNDENINLAQLRRRKANDFINNNNNNINNFKNNRHSLNIDLQERQTKSARTFDNSKSKLKNVPTNSFKNHDQRQQISQPQRQQQQSQQSANIPRPRTQPDINAQYNNSNINQDNFKQQQHQRLQYQQSVKSDLKSFDQEIPKRYSTIRSNQRPLSGQFVQNKLFNNEQPTSGISLDQNNFQHQFIFNSNNHSPVQQQQQQQPTQQQQQTWPNAPRPITHHMQPQNTLQQHLNLQPPPGLSLNTQSTSSNGSTSMSQQQMAALINNQLYYMQPNDYMTQLTAAQEYAAAMAVLQTNQIYFTNQSLPQQPQQQSQQQQQQMSPMSQLGIQRQSKAIPIVNPHQFNQRNL